MGHILYAPIVFLGDDIVIVKQTKEFEVDDAIAQHIIELNNRGYQTDYCCSGHVGEYSPGYISFDMATSVYIKQYVYHAPKGWYFSFNRDARVGVYMKLHDRPISARLIEVRLLALLTWIHKLPRRKDPYSTIHAEIVRGDTNRKHN